MTELIRETLFDQTKDYVDCLAKLDFDRLREAMLPLFEAAAHAVQVAGYEQDDAVIDRFVVCHVKDDEITILADHFSTKAFFTASVSNQLIQQSFDTTNEQDVEIVSLRVTATLERWPD